MNTFKLAVGFIVAVVANL